MSNSIISYSLGINSDQVSKVKLDSQATSSAKDKYHFLFQKNYDTSSKIKRALIEYGPINKSDVDFLIDIPNIDNLNNRLLVGANYWYKGNNYPKEFLPRMFERENVYFDRVLNIIYQDKEPTTSNLYNFILYSNIIRNYYNYLEEDAEFVDKDVTGSADDDI